MHMPWPSHSCRYKASASITNTNLSVVHIGSLTSGARAPRKTAFAGEICSGSDYFLAIVRRFGFVIGERRRAVWSRRERSGPGVELSAAGPRHK
ncbi:hypothetical protein ACFXTN_024421 [Malus domestica]